MCNTAEKPKRRRRKSGPLTPETAVAATPAEQPAAFPDALTALSPSVVLETIASLGLVALPVSHVADRLRVGVDDLTPHLIALTDADLAYTWMWHDEERYEATEHLRRVAHENAAIVRGEYEPAAIEYETVVTMSASEADRRKLRINASGRRWTAKYKEDPPDRLDWSPVIRESDMKCDPPGTLESFPWRPPGAHPAGIESDRREGLVRPAIIIMGVRPWPLPGQSRGDHQHRTKTWRPVDPRGPQPNPRGLPSERGRRPWDAADDAAVARWESANPLERGRDGGVVCAGCGGRELWDGMLGMERVSGGEFCAACSRTSRDPVGNQEV